MRRQDGEVGPGHDGLAEERRGFASGDGYADAVHLEAMQAVDAEANDMVVAPVDEPVGGGAIEEVVFAGSLPDKMPRILGIAGENTTAMCLEGLELAGGGLVEVTLLVGDRVLVAAGGGRHEADAENAAIGGVAKAFDGPAVSAIRSFECPGERGVQEAVAVRGD